MSIFIGSTVAGFVATGNTSGNAAALGSGVSTITSNPNSINGLTVYSVNINGQTYYAATVSTTTNTTTTTTSIYNQVNNTALIIGLVVGLVGAAILIVGSIFGYKKYKKTQRGQRLINDDPDVEKARPNPVTQNNENTINPSESANNDVKVTRRASVLTPDLPNFNNNRLHSPLSNNPTEQRIPSAAMSVTMLDYTIPNNEQFSNKPMTPVELIKFD